MLGQFCPGPGGFRVGNVKIPYYRVKGANGFFEPTPQMKSVGFLPRPLGPNGPEAWRRAWVLYEDWQKYRRGEIAPPECKYLLGSLGEAWERYRRTQAWNDKAPGTRREWEYAWGWIESHRVVEGSDLTFVDVDPNTIELEMIEALRTRVRDAVSEHAAHKIIKVWRALWKVMAAMRYCEAHADPSKGIRNVQPQGRSETWSEGEVARLVKQAWRMRLYGLAAIIGVIWDTQFSPGDARSLVRCQQKQDRKGTYYTTKRGKTRKEAIGTTSRRVARLVDAYLEAVGLELHDDAPIFRDVRGKPYTMFSLDAQFRLVRDVEFPGEKRRLMDMRRSGAVEAEAGDVAPLALASKMANSIDVSAKLQDTYLPRRVAVIRQADDARRRGRRALRENE
jgi:hypothetical protein